MKKKLNKKLIICLIIDFILLILLFVLLNVFIQKNIIIKQTEIVFYKQNKDELNKAVFKINKKNNDKGIKVNGVKSIYYDKTADTHYIDFALPTQLFDLFSSYRGIVYSENDTPYVFGIKENELEKITENEWKYSKNGNQGFVKRIDYKWFIYNIDFWWRNVYIFIQIINLLEKRKCAFVNEFYNSTVNGSVPLQDATKKISL